MLVAIDHFSRKILACCPLGGPNAGSVVEALEDAFLRHEAPRHVITHEQGVFVSEVFAALLRHWNVKQRFGAVGNHGSIAVTERVIQILKREWLARVSLIRGMNHLSGLLVDFELYCNCHRCHRELGGATPPMIYQRRRWRKPDRSAKTIRGHIRTRHFPEPRITVHELAA